MRKPKFLAMTLAVALVAGAIIEAPVAVRAETTVTAAPSESQGDSRPSESQGDRRPSESQGDSRPSESQGDSRPSESQGDAPTTVDFEMVDPDEVGWETTPWNKDDRWYLHFVIPNGDALAERNGKCYVTLYKDGEEINKMSRQYFTAGGTFASSIMESGSYKFSVYVEAEVDGEVKRSNEIFSPEQVYTAPEQRLGKVQDVVWDAEKTGVFYFTPLEDDVDYYWIRGYRDENGFMAHRYGRGVGDGFGTTVTTEDGRIEVDVSDFVKEYGEGIYYVTIQAFSKKIDITANGYESELSAALDTRAKSETVSDKIADAVKSNSPTDAVAAIKSTIPMNDLATNMQINDTVLGQIKDLEAAYEEANNVTVEEPKVSAEAAALGVDNSKISMVGAAFNANPNSTVSLDISVPETKVTVPTGYKDGVQLDIKLNGASSSDGTLEMPITITMPAPTGVDLNKLTLWHYHGDNREAVVVKDNKDGTITFTVTSFSVFLFTEEQTGGNQTGEDQTGGNQTGEDQTGGNQTGGDQTGGNQPSGDQTGSNSTTNNNNSASSSSTSSTQTVTEEKKAPVAIEYVVKRGDNMAKIARRHGLTLGQLIALNPQVKNPARIYAGQILIVGYTNGEAAAADAANAEYYIVQRGDSLFKIALKNKLTLLELKVLNPKLFAQRYIFAGQKVRVK